MYCYEVKISFQELPALCYQLSRLLKHGFILLDGPLGAGKTAFCQQFLASLGYCQVQSPTFSLVQSYTDGQKKIFHADLYRIEYATQLRDLELEFYQEELFLVEWGRQFEEYLQPLICCLYIDKVANDENLRYYRFEFFDPLGTGYIQSLPF